VPTLGEAGYPLLVFQNFYVIFGPKNMDKPIVEKLRAAFMKAIESPIELRISNGTNYLAHGRSEAKMQDQRSLWDFRSLRTVFRSIALRSARPSGALLERARSV
jgi:hypothetical protein